MASEEALTVDGLPEVVHPRTEIPLTLVKALTFRSSPCVAVRISRRIWRVWFSGSVMRNPLGPAI
jgi:hypothetical protein